MVNKRTRERVAACETVGLHYWADHPVAGHVWAVDDHQAAHVVRIESKTGAARHVCAETPDSEVIAGTACTDAATCFAKSNRKESA